MADAAFFRKHGGCVSVHHGARAGTAMFSVGNTRLSLCTARARTSRCLLCCSAAVVPLSLKGICADHTTGAWGRAMRCSMSMALVGAMVPRRVAAYLSTLTAVSVLQ
jgi:hypothetical protein